MHSPFASVPRRIEGKNLDQSYFGGESAALPIRRNLDQGR